MKEAFHRYVADTTLAGGGAVTGQTVAPGNTTTTLLLMFVFPLIKEVIFRLIDKRKKSKHEKEQ